MSELSGTPLTDAIWKDSDEGNIAINLSVLAESLELRIADLERAISVANAAREELERDKAMLDWLLCNMRVMRANANGATHYIDVPPADSLKGAIRAAMTGKEG